MKQLTQKQLYIAQKSPWIFTPEIEKIVTDMQRHVILANNAMYQELPHTTKHKVNIAQEYLKNLRDYLAVLENKASEAIVEKGELENDE